VAAADAAEIQSGLRWNVKDESILRTRRPWSSKLTGRRIDLNAPMKRLDIPRPDAEREIGRTGNLDEVIRVTESEVATFNLEFATHGLRASPRLVINREHVMPFWRCDV
jgi:hypothetical protein